MEYNWTITALECKALEDGLTNVISTIHWRYSATNENGITAETYGAQNVSLDTLVNPENFIQYINVTKEIIIGWLESTLDITLIQENLNKQIDLIITPVIVSLPLPFTN